MPWRAAAYRQIQRVDSVASALTAWHRPTFLVVTNGGGGGALATPAGFGVAALVIVSPTSLKSGQIDHTHQQFKEHETQNWMEAPACKRVCSTRHYYKCES